MEPNILINCYSQILQAEFYRLKKEYEKAELLYLEAIEILEESFGSDDIRYIWIFFFCYHSLWVDCKCCIINLEYSLMLPL